MDFKVPEDLHTNRNGHVMNIIEDDKSIGHHTPIRNPFEPFSENEKMRSSPSNGKLFPNGTAPDEGGVINKNGEYGPVTYGF